MRFKRVASAVALMLAMQAGVAGAVGTLIPSSGRVDMVHDAERGVIYVSEGDRVLRYSLASGSFLAPIVLGGQLAGLDLSPDGDTLAVADRSSSATDVWVHLVDLDDLSVTRKNAIKAYGESGTFTVAYAGDGALVATGTYAGSGWVPMRRLDPMTGQWTELASVRQNTMLAASDAGNAIAFAEANISDGAWGRYDVLGGQVVRRSGYTNGTSWFNFEIATNAAGNQFAIPTYGGTFVYDGAYAKVATLGSYAGPQPIGVAYHPVEAKAYFPWADSSQVRVYDMASFSQVGAYDFQDTFRHTGNGAFVQGRTKLSRDGSLLMVSVTGGVRFLQVYAPLAAANLAASTQAGTPVTVALQGSIGNGGTLAYSLAQAPVHGTVQIVGGQATYTPAAGFSGADSFSYRASYGRASADATVALTVIQPNRAPVAVDDAAYTRNKPVAIAVLANDSDPDGDALNLTALTVPTKGKAVIQGNTVVYTPPKNFSGSTSFSYTVSDGRGGSSVGRVTVTRN